MAHDGFVGIIFIGTMITNGTQYTTTHSAISTKDHCVGKIIITYDG
jgi:hypothetical protein